MNEVEKRVTINYDSYLFFKTILENEIDHSPEGEAKNLLKEIYWHIQTNSTFVEGVYQRVKKLQKGKKLDEFSLGVIDYFLARIFAQRKEFHISLKLLREATDLFKDREPVYLEALNKEISILKLADHYTEN